MRRNLVNVCRQTPLLRAQCYQQQMSTQSRSRSLSRLCRPSCPSVSCRSSRASRALPRHFSSDLRPQSGLSLSLSLKILAATLTAVTGYATYTVVVQEKPFFVPLWICSKRRRPFIQEIDREVILDEIKSKLHDRLSVDEIVSDVLGIPIEFTGEENFEIFILSSNPSIAGLRISPSSPHFSLTARPLCFDDGIDKLLLGFAPSESQSEDAGSRDSKLPWAEIIVNGTVTIRGIHSKREADLEFRASRDLYSRTCPKIPVTIMSYKEGKEEINQRLW